MNGGDEGRVQVSEQRGTETRLHKVAQTDNT